VYWQHVAVNPDIPAVSCLVNIQILTASSICVQMSDNYFTFHIIVTYLFVVYLTTFFFQ
jgi:hypothetical protein